MAAYTVINSPREHFISILVSRRVERGFPMDILQAPLVSVKLGISNDIHFSLTLSHYSDRHVSVQSTKVYVISRLSSTVTSLGCTAATAGASTATTAVASTATTAVASTATTAVASTATTAVASTATTAVASTATTAVASTATTAVASTATTAVASTATTAVASTATKAVASTATTAVSPTTNTTWTITRWDLGRRHFPWFGFFVTFDVFASWCSPISDGGHIQTCRYCCY